MRKITILLLVLGLAAMYACNKDETKATLKSPVTASVLSIPGGSEVVLKKSDSAVPLVYTWTTSDFGQSVVISYNVQMDKVGNGFKDPISLGIVNNVTSLTILTSDLNAKLLPMEFDPAKPDPIALEFRVQATINQYVLPVNSAVKGQQITPYFVKIVYPILFVPGNYQNWNPADSTTTIASKLSNGKYEGYIYINNDAPEYKYTQGNSWTNNWGDNAADGTLDKNGDNIKPGSKGYYKLNVDLPNLKHTYLKTTWSVIGDASGGWDKDNAMTYDEAQKNWTVTLTLSDGGIKFRANNGWDLNYGDDGTKLGTLKEGGDNITVTAGKYTIIMDLSKPIYKYKLVKN
jgi:hypothetical protein